MAAPARSRERLLAAASTLFAERGFAATTTRDVAERAGVDAALIVRHFGSKVGLYLACLQFDDDADGPADLLQTDRMLSMLARVDAGGPGPIFQAAVQNNPDDKVRSATRAAMSERVVEPLRQYFTQAGVDRPDLRAELISAAFAGIALGRASGTFPLLSEVPASDLVALIQEIFGPGSGA